MTKQLKHPDTSSIMLLLIHHTYGGMTFSNVKVSTRCSDEAVLRALPPPLSPSSNWPRTLPSQGKNLGSTPFGDATTLSID